MKKILTIVTLVCVASFSADVRANTVALDFTGGQSFALGNNPGNSMTLGWGFTLNQAVLLTDLGIWDGTQFTPVPLGDFGSVGDGLAQSHTVTVWTSAGVRVVSTVIPSGTGATLVDDFRYMSVAPTVLAAGSYVIGATYTGAFTTDTIHYNVTTVTTTPELTYDGTRGVGGADQFSATNQIGNVNSYFGPNFQFSPATNGDGGNGNGNGVPEGGQTILLMATAALPLFLLRRRLVRR